MSENGVYAYDLAGNWCEECGQAKSFRLFPGTLTGCKTCDEVITRHRCTGRPDIGGMTDGQSWECRECGSVWTATEVEEACPDCCGDCGHRITVKRWFVIEGDRMATAPRYSPQPFRLFRNLFANMSFQAASPPGSCYRTASGAMVHVKPGCRCRT